MSGTCAAIVYGCKCELPAAGMTTMACGHEHFGTALVCADCRVAMLTLMAAGDFTCDPCADADGHCCPLAEVRFEAATAGASP